LKSGDSGTVNYRKVLNDRMARFSPLDPTAWMTVSIESDSQRHEPCGSNLAENVELDNRYTTLKNVMAG
jgi:hypothetical protein